MAAKQSENGIDIYGFSKKGENEGQVLIGRRNGASQKKGKWMSSLSAAKKDEFWLNECPFSGAENCLRCLKTSRMFKSV